MLYLYPNNARDFTYNGEPIKNAFDAHVVRDDTFILTFNVLLDDKGEYKKIKKEMIVSALTPDGRNQFRVWDIIKKSDHIQVECLHLLYDLNKRVVGSVNINNQNLITGIEIYKNAFKSSFEPFTISSSVMTKNRTFNTDNSELYFNALDVLLDGAHSIVGTWECQMLLNGFDIRLVDRVGKDTHALLYEKKNIGEFESDETNQDIITRIYAKSIFRPENAETDTPDTKLEIVVESPLINEYSMVYEAHYTNNDCKTVEELEKWAKRKFTYDKVDLPKRTIKVEANVVGGTEINYGDTLVLKYLTHDIDETIRCSGYDYDGINGVYYSITLGTIQTSIGGQMKSAIADHTETYYKNEINKQIENITHIVMSSNGYNRTAYGPDPVPNPIDGDMWYQFDPATPNDVVQKIYKNGMWKIFLDDYMGERVKEKIAEINQQATQLQIQITEAEKRADQAILDSGNALNVVDDAKRLMEENGKNITEALDKVKESTSKIDNLEDISDVTMDVIGNDGLISYSNNRLSVPSKDDKTTFTVNKYENVDVLHNGEGFLVGKTYTLSWSQLEESCVALGSVTVTLKE